MKDVWIKNVNGQEFTLEEYKQWMYHKEHEYECECCPEHSFTYSNNGQLPCGQYRCWVTAHCK